MMTDEERMKKIRNRTAEIRHQDSRKKQIFRKRISGTTNCGRIL